MTEIKSLQCRPKQCISYITYHFAGISLSSFTSRNDKKFSGLIEFMGAFLVSGQAVRKAGQ